MSFVPIKDSLILLSKSRKRKKDYQKLILLELAKSGPVKASVLTKNISKEGKSSPSYRTIDRNLSSLIKSGLVNKMPYILDASVSYALSLSGYIFSIILGSIKNGENLVYFEEGYLLKNQKYFVDSFRQLWETSEEDAFALLPLFLTRKGQRLLRNLDDLEKPAIEQLRKWEILLSTSPSMID